MVQDGTKATKEEAPPFSKGSHPQGSQDHTNLSFSNLYDPQEGGGGESWLGTRGLLFTAVA